MYARVNDDSNEEVYSSSNADNKISKNPNEIQMNVLIHQQLQGDDIDAITISTSTLGKPENHYLGNDNTINSSNSNNNNNNIPRFSLSAHLIKLLQSAINRQPKLFWISILSSFLLIFALILAFGFRGGDGKHYFRHSPQPSPPPPSDPDPWAQFSTTSSRGAIATDNALCSDVGLDMLNRGGNAIDAAVAACLCLGVLSPASSGIGGGAYILTFNSTAQTTSFLDSRETAPASASPSMFDSNPSLSQDGGLAVATPGELRGLYQVWTEQSSGKISWREIVEPAASMAEDWAVSANLALLLQEVRPQLFSAEARYRPLQLLYLKTDRFGALTLPKEKGDRVHQPILAQTLRHIGEQGPDYLYVIMAAQLAQEV